MPLSDATFEGDQLRVPVDQTTVKDAAEFDDINDQLSPAQEEQLYRSYQRAYRTSAGPAGDDDMAAAGRAGGQAKRETAGRDTCGPNTDEAMAPSEEQLPVGTQRRETGRARLASTWSPSK